MRHGGHWVHQGSLGSLARAQGVVGFIRGRWVHSGGRWFNPVSLGSLTRALGVVGFIVGSLGSLACSLRVDGVIGGRWVHLSAHLESMGSFKVVAIT